jgi:hypothetical protein
MSLNILQKLLQPCLISPDTLHSARFMTHQPTFAITVFAVQGAASQEIWNNISRNVKINFTEIKKNMGFFDVIECNLVRRFRISSLHLQGNLCD